MDSEQAATPLDDSDDPIGRRLRQAHIVADDVEADHALAEARRTLAGRSPRPATLSRYVLLQRLGAGGAGVVFRAFDPVLERAVAIKVLRGRYPGLERSQGRLRLVREAKTLAKLSHPNVVAIYDAGTYEDLGSDAIELEGAAVFIVMELVTGTTLRRWLAERERSLREILAAMLAAGRGLAAAHEAGLIHRDFKPENVLVGEDGRVRVADFGLARPSLVDDEDGPPTPSSASPIDLTGTGALMGTPAYMSPEQHRGEPLDARSDQYSFCIALYEAVCGQRPFPNASLPELEHSKLAGLPRASTGARPLPRRVLEVVRRGASPARADRYPDMKALLHDLERSTRRHAAVPIAAAGLLVIGTAVVLAPSSDKCPDIPDALPERWTAAHRSAIASAFESAGPHYAAQTWARAEAVLDGYAEDWRALRELSCATLESRATERRAMADCLALRAASFKALVDAFEHADAKVVEHAVGSAQALPEIEVCSRHDLRDLPGDPPSSVAQAEAAQAVRMEIAAVRVTVSTGHAAEAIARADEIDARAIEVDYAPLRAETTLLAAEARMFAGDRGAVAGLRQAVALGREAKHPRVEFWGWHRLAHVSGVLDRQYDQGIWYLELAEGLANETPSREQQFVLLLSRAQIAAEAAKYDEAIAAGEGALAMAIAMDGEDSTRVADVLEALAQSRASTRRLEEADRDALRCLEIREAALGSFHPRAIVALGTAGAIALERGELQRAHEQQAEAVNRLERNGLTKHPMMAVSRQNLANVLVALDDIEGARAEIGRTLELLAELYGEQHPRYASALHNRGALELNHGDPARALADFERAIAIYEATVGTEHPEAKNSLHSRERARQKLAAAH